MKLKVANGGAELAVSDENFGHVYNQSLVFQVVNAYLAGGRAGTKAQKTRSEVRGGSAKPYRQKGTGNARQGSIRAPHYSGGGVALGPKPRSYDQRTPRKMVQAALRVALSDRARTGRLRLVDQWAFDAPKTKQAIAALAALESATGVTAARIPAMALRSSGGQSWAASTARSPHGQERAACRCAQNAAIIPASVAGCACSIHHSAIRRLWTGRHCRFDRVLRAGAP